jgi:hypothetical protein
MVDVSLPAPTLQTLRLRLRPFTQADQDDLFALHSNARVLRYWDAPPWSDRTRESLGYEPPRADPYLGLTCEEAQALADHEQRRLVDRTPDFHARRADLVSNRVNVLFDENGVVIDADIG